MIWQVYYWLHISAKTARKKLRRKSILRNHLSNVRLYISAANWYGEESVPVPVAVDGGN